MFFHLLTPDRGRQHQNVQEDLVRVVDHQHRVDQVHKDLIAPKAVLQVPEDPEAVLDVPRAGRRHLSILEDPVVAHATQMHPAA